MKRRSKAAAWIAVVFLGLVAAYSNCGPKRFESLQDIITGNPMRDGASRVLYSVCSTLSRCDSQVSYNNCVSGVMATVGIAPRLGLANDTGTPYSDIVTANANGTILANTGALDQCLSDISQLSCSAPEVQGAYVSTASNPYAGVPNMIPTQPGSCSGVFTPTVAPKVLLVGGYAGGTDVANTLIGDGTAAWTSSGNTFPGGAIQDVQTITFNGAVYALGGNHTNNPNTSIGGIYKTTDGISWTPVGSFPAGQVRSQGVALYFNNKMWYLGGADGSGAHKNVWNSSDGGATWNDLGNNLPQAVNSMSGTVYQGKMWIAGGNGGAADSSAVYSSGDGVTWTLAGNLPMALDRGAMVTFQNAMWWLGGTYGGTIVQSTGQIWQSTDGATWTAVGTLPNGADYGHAAAVYQTKIIFSTGYEGSGGTYMSSDGVTWSARVPFVGGGFRTYTSIALLP